MALELGLLLTPAIALIVYLIVRSTDPRQQGPRDAMPQAPIVAGPLDAVGKNLSASGELKAGSAALARSQATREVTALANALAPACAVQRDAKSEQELRALLEELEGAAQAVRRELAARAAMPAE